MTAGRRWQRGRVGAEAAEWNLSGRSSVVTERSATARATGSRSEAEEELRPAHPQRDGAAGGAEQLISFGVTGLLSVALWAAAVRW